MQERSLRIRTPSHPLLKRQPLKKLTIRRRRKKATNKRRRRMRKRKVNPLPKKVRRLQRQTDLVNRKRKRSDQAT